MRTGLKSVFIIVLLGAVLYGGAKAYLRYQVESTLDDFALSIGSHGDLRYGDIDTDLRGRVVVHDMVLEANEMPEPVVIDRVSVSGPNALYALDPRPTWTPATHHRA